MQADSSLEQQRSLIKEKEIILQGVFDLAKANIPVPAELQQLVSDVLQNAIVPLEVQNQQQIKVLQQQQQQEMMQMQQQAQEEGQGQEMQPEQESQQLQPQE
jgi:hypothetical protein